MGLHDGTPVRCMDSEVRKISRNDTYYYNSDTDTLFLGGYPVYESSLWALKIEGWVIAQKDGERCVTNGDKYIVAYGNNKELSVKEACEIMNGFKQY